MIDGQSVGKIKLAFRAAVNMVERSRMGRAALAGNATVATVASPMRAMEVNFFMGMSSCKVCGLLFDPRRA